MERTDTAAGFTRGRRPDVKVISREPVDKHTVWHGAWDATKKAVESQSPEAWKKRIMNVIDTKIVPKLPVDKQIRYVLNREKIEEAAAVAGAGITTAEIVGAVVAIHYIGNRAVNSEFVRGRKIRAINRKLEKKYGKFKPAEYVQVKTMWEQSSDAPASGKWNITPAPTVGEAKRSLQEVAKLYTERERFSDWVKDIGGVFAEKYGSTEAERFMETMTVLAERAETAGLKFPPGSFIELALTLKDPEEVHRTISMLTSTSSEQWKSVLDALNGEFTADPILALNALRVVFTDAYLEAASRNGKTSIGTSRFLERLRGQQLFNKWFNIQLEGAPELLHVSQLIPDMNVESLVEALQQITTEARDFEPIIEPSVAALVAAYNGKSLLQQEIETAQIMAMLDAAKGKRREYILYPSREAARFRMDEQQESPWSQLNIQPPKSGEIDVSALHYSSNTVSKSSAGKQDRVRISQRKKQARHQMEDARKAIAERVDYAQWTQDHRGLLDIQEVLRQRDIDRQFVPFFSRVWEHARELALGENQDGEFLRQIEAVQEARTGGNEDQTISRMTDFLRYMFKHLPRGQQSSLRKHSLGMPAYRQLAGIWVRHLDFTGFDQLRKLAERH